MQRQRGELVPIAEALADLPGPVKALRRDRPPQRGFTLADQIDRLVGASEATPDRGFLARLMALCSLPRSNPRDRLRYVRRNGPYTLAMTAGVNNKLPLRQFSTPNPRVDLHRSGTHPKPCVGSRRLAVGFHAGTRHLQQRR